MLIAKCIFILYLFVFFLTKSFGTFVYRPTMKPAAGQNKIDEKEANSEVKFARSNRVLEQQLTCFVKIMKFLEKRKHTKWTGFERAKNMHGNTKIFCSFNGISTRFTRSTKRIDWMRGRGSEKVGEIQYMKHLVRIFGRIWLYAHLIRSQSLKLRRNKQLQSYNSQLWIEWAAQQTANNTDTHTHTRKWKIVGKSTLTQTLCIHHRKLHHDLSITSWVYFVVHMFCILFFISFLFSGGCKV